MLQTMTYLTRAEVSTSDYLTITDYHAGLLKQHGITLSSYATYCLAKVVANNLDYLLNMSYQNVEKALLVAGKGGFK